MRCPNCKTESPSGKKFCGDCGAPLPNLCPKCDADNPAGKRFCGATLASTAAASSANKSTDAAIRVADASGDESLEAERKTVTALFADIKGSMDLMEDLDPEASARYTPRFACKKRCGVTQRNFERREILRSMHGSASRFTSFARVIVFDKRGQGLSDRLAEQTLEERIGDVRAVMMRRVPSARLFFAGRKVARCRLCSRHLSRSNFGAGAVRQLCVDEGGAMGHQRRAMGAVPSASGERPGVGESAAQG